MPRLVEKEFVSTEDLDKSPSEVNGVKSGYTVYSYATTESINGSGTQDSEKSLGNFKDIEKTSSDKDIEARSDSIQTRVEHESATTDLVPESTPETVPSESARLTENYGEIAIIIFLCLLVIIALGIAFRKK